MNISRKNIVLSIVLAICLLVCASIYTGRSESLEPVTKNTVGFTDPYVLRDWVPDSIFNSITAYIQYYLATNNISGTNLTITSQPKQLANGVSFSFIIPGNSTAYQVDAGIQYLGGTLITSVYINQTTVSIAIAPNIYDTYYVNFDSLTSAGLTTNQIYEIQQQLYKVAPRSEVTLDTSSIKQTISKGSTITSFTLAINGNKYTAQNTSSGITDIHLSLRDSSGGQVFNSGKVSVNF